MLNVALVSMPFTILTIPSLGLAQLQAVVRNQMESRASINIAHCYLDFAEFAGGLEQMALLGAYDNVGLTEWIFRLAAFDLPDDQESFREIFFAGYPLPRKKKAFALALELRSRIAVFLDAIIERYDLSNKQVVGFTSMMWQNIPSFALARRLKQINPKIITVLGGPNADFPMGKAIVDNVSQIDYAFSGDGLNAFPAFLESVIVDDYKSIRRMRGVYFRANVESLEDSACVSPADVIAMQEHRAQGSAYSDKLEKRRALADRSGEPFDLEKMPLLDYSDYLDRLEKLPFAKQLKTKLILLFQTSNGCWKADRAPCSFCGLTPHKFRQMTPETAKSYINETIKKYVGSFTFFQATDCNMPPEYLHQVLPFVNRDKAVPLQYEVTSRISVEDMAHMANANIVLPQPGIESLSTKTLGIMHKSVNSFHNIRFLKNCVEFGLFPIWNYIYGFPEKNYTEFDSDRLLNDIQTILHLPPPANFGRITFSRYSEYFDNPEEFALKLKPMDLYYALYPFDESVISQLAYLFEDKDFFQNFWNKNSSTLQAINLEVVCWQAKFRDAIPQLHFQDETTIFDSRRGKAVSHRITEMEYAILTFLDEPHSIDEIMARFGLISEESTSFLNRFEKFKLIFSENDKHLSVVCKKSLLTAANFEKYYLLFMQSVGVLP